MTDTTVPCPMCGQNLFQNDKRAETRSDSMYCGSRDCGLSLMWMSRNDVTRFRLRFSDALAAARADAERPLGELLAVIHHDGGHYQQEHGTEKAVSDAIDIVCAERNALSSARSDGYEQAREQAAMIASGYEFAPGMGVRERIKNIVDKIRAMQPRPAEAGER